MGFCHLTSHKTGHRESRDTVDWSVSKSTARQAVFAIADSARTRIPQGIRSFNEIWANKQTAIHRKRESGRVGNDNRRRCLSECDRRWPDFLKVERGFRTRARPRRIQAQKKLSQITEVVEVFRVCGFHRLCSSGEPRFTRKRLSLSPPT